MGHPAYLVISSIVYKYTTCIYTIYINNIYIVYKYTTCIYIRMHICIHASMYEVRLTETRQ